MQVQVAMSWSLVAVVHLVAATLRCVVVLEVAWTVDV